MLNLVWIGLAGGIGSIARYLLSTLTMNWFEVPYLYGTFVVNLLGSFVMGFVVEASLNNSLISPSLRLILTVGFLGGFTTYSSFNQEVIQQIQTGHYYKAFLYIFMTLIFCLVAGYLGWGLARKITG